MLARYGGEEFAVICREIEKEGALALGERLRAAVERAAFEHEGRVIPVTISVGAAVAHKPQQVQPLIAAADAAMYEAKRAGRNRVVLSLTADLFACGRGRWYVDAADEGTSSSRARGPLPRGPDRGPQLSRVGRSARRKCARQQRRGVARGGRRRRRAGRPRGPVSEAEALKPRPDLPPVERALVVIGATPAQAGQGGQPARAASRTAGAAGAAAAW